MMAMDILFDIDDTLFPSSDFSALARRNALTAMIRMGLHEDYDTLKEELDKVIEEKGSNFQSHFDELCRRRGISHPARYIAAAIAAYHDTKTSIQPYPKVPYALLKLKERGHKLYIATNGSSVKQWDKLIRLGIALYFDGVFVSEDIGRQKDEQFFREVLSRLGSEPEGCLMVGDREDADIRPAKAVGIRTVRVLCGRRKDEPSEADHVISDIEQLLGILKRL
jgi:putative hydrolase of the HAD superfamily